MITLHANMFNLKIKIANFNLCKSNLINFLKFHHLNLAYLRI